MANELIILFMSTIFLVIGVIQIQKGNYLMKHGKEANAIVFTNNPDTDGKNSGLYYPVVRFLTEEKVWVTHQLSIGYSPPLEEGTKLTVIYDPENPTTVEISSSTNLEILPRCFVALGVCGMALVILEVLDVIHFVD